MRTSILRTLVSSAVLVCAVASSGCLVKNDRGDLVASRVVQAKAGASPGAACVYDPGQAELSHGFLNIALQDFYQHGGLIENRLSTNPSATGRLNTNDFIVTSARVSYESPDGKLSGLPDQTVPTSGSVPSGSKLAVGTDLITPDIGALIRAKLPAGGASALRLQIYYEGKLLDGSSVRTSAYPYVVNIFNNPSPGQACAPPTPPQTATTLTFCEGAAAGGALGQDTQFNCAYR